MRNRSLNHSTFCHQSHLVWGTKYRRPYLKECVKQDFVSKVYELTKKYPEMWIEEINTDRDHVHIQIETAPMLSVANVVKVIKQATSISLYKKHIQQQGEKEDASQLRFDF